MGRSPVTTTVFLSLLDMVVLARIVEEEFQRSVGANGTSDEYRQQDQAGSRQSAIVNLSTHSLICRASGLDHFDHSVKTQLSRI